MRKSLREYTNEELYNYMEENEKTDITELSAFCSEILRRIINGEFNIKFKKFKEDISSINMRKSLEKFISDLNWSKEILHESQEFLRKWDERDDFFYKENNISKMSEEVDKAEREHLRNAVNYYEKKLC